MPSANSATGRKPTISATTVRRRLTNTFLAAGLGLGLILPAGLFIASGVAAHVPDGDGPCARWTSTTRPPDYVHVYRNKSGRIDRVPFRRYLVVVLGKEWPGYLPHAVIEAGAVAAKQYAWYHAMSPRRMRDGRCFDVRDGIQDQLYRPEHSRVRQDHYDAVDRTWNVTLIKNDHFFMTGYRRGYKGRCGRDANGWKLFARTATRCAMSGKDYLQILRIYYGPDLQIRSGSASRAEPQMAPTAQAPSVQAPTRSVLFNVL
ncbi:MAG TPA: SpoIID/LytB domain-containing protein [Candidatus Limnocylindria bacterium]|nr:SpoIID/LytB domain-containing protein [Candidatus Limnocylindria bacterium]